MTVLTPKIHATSKRNAAFPTEILGLMELINPGSVGATETIIATTARQFCQYSVLSTVTPVPQKKRRYLQNHTNTYTVPVVGT